MDQVGYRYSNLDLRVYDYQEKPEGSHFSVELKAEGDPATPEGDHATPEGDQATSGAETVQVRAGLRDRLLLFEHPDNPSLKDLIEIGRELGDLLLPPQARARFEQARDGRETTDRLRLRLRFESFPLANVPWEYAYLPVADTPEGQESLAGFIALDARVSMVRYESLEAEAKTLDPIDPEKINVVCLFANPRLPGTAPLDLKAERRRIDAALKKQRINPHSYLHATATDLIDSTDLFPHIFHFGGHGMFGGEIGPQATVGEGFLLLEDKDKGWKVIASETLGTTLQGAGTRLAVLSACDAAHRDDIHAWSGVAPALVKHAAIPAVVGMQYPVADLSAYTFSESFYKRIASGDPIDHAVTAGRRAVSIDGSKDWGAAVLYLRAEKGVLFPRLAAQGDWETVKRGAAEQAGEALTELQGDAGHLGRLIPEVYVHRKAAEARLAAFVEGDCRAVVVTGDSGVGKTNLLASWSSDLQRAEHAVLFYDCRKAPGPDIRTEIARHLGIAGPDEVVPALKAVAQQAPSGKRLVLVFDALNEFRGSGDSGPRELLKTLDNLVSDADSDAVNIVISCSSAMWRKLERERATELCWSHYLTDGANRTLEIGIFDDTELGEASVAYQKFFDIKSDLKSQAADREELHLPLALRLLCETYRGQPVPHGAGFYIDLFSAYYQRVVRNEVDAEFLRQLAGLMMSTSKPALPASSLIKASGVLKEQTLSTSVDSSLNHLLDEGALTQIFDSASMDDLVSFTHTRFGAFVLALMLKDQSPPEQKRSVRLLVSKVEEFPPAWDAARITLVLSKNKAALADLAGDKDPELWELATEALRSIFMEYRDEGKAFLQEFASSGKPELESLASRVLHRLGPRAPELYRWVATNVDSDNVRLSATYSLYIWHNSDPEFPYEVLKGLVPQVSLVRLFLTKKILMFLSDLTITIYINHCEEQQVIAETSAIWHDVLKNRLPIRLIAPAVTALNFVPLVSDRVSRRILEAMSLPKKAGSSASDALFDVPPSQRDSLRRSIPFLDPSTKVSDAQDLLTELFNSPSALQSVQAGMIVAIHSCADFASTKPVVMSVFEKVKPEARCWVLLAYNVLFVEPAIAADWLPVLEELTRRLIEEDPTLLAKGGCLGLEEFDPILLPLGLACGKTPKPMSFFSELLKGADAKKPEWLAGCLHALGPVGFYYPEQVLALFTDALPDKTTAPVVAALKEPLILMRTVHEDLVDGFMRTAGWGEEDQIAVRGQSNALVVRNYIFRIGIYNNGIHQAINYPRMRKGLLQAAMSILADAKSEKAFLSPYTKQIFKMLKDADYELLQWTKPE